MKHNFSSIIIIGLLVVGCRPEQSVTEFNQVSRGSASLSENPDIDPGICDSNENLEQCNSDIKCQPLFDNARIANSENYLGCIEIPSEEISNEEVPVEVLPVEEEDIVDSDIPSEEPNAPDTPIAESPDEEESEQASEVPTVGSSNSDSGNNSGGNLGSVEIVTGDNNDEGQSDEIGNDTSTSSNNDCGANKVIICHIPPGNSGALHSMCISKQGWENGHMGHHGKKTESSDHLGACSQEDIEENSSSGEIEIKS